MLTAKERSVLKGIAAKEKTAINVGKKGINQALVEEVSRALFHKEIVKIALLPSSLLEKEQAANELAAKTQSEIVQTVGSKVVLYKRSDKKEIEHLIAPKNP